MYTELEPITRQEIRKGAGWGITVGILLIILGIVAITLPFATAIAPKSSVENHSNFELPRIHS